MSNQTNYQLQIFQGNNTKKPLTNTKYKISFNGKVLITDVTDTQGKTKLISISGNPIVKLEVYNSKMNNGKGGYIVPSLYYFPDASKIMLGILNLNDYKPTKPLTFDNVGKQSVHVPQRPLVLLPEDKVVNKVQQVFLKPYLIVQLRKADKKVFVTRLNYDVLYATAKNNSKDEKDIVKVDGKLLKGLRTLRDGLTDFINIDFPVIIKFYGGDLGKVNVYTEVLYPFYAHQDVVKIQYVKAAPATTAPKINNTTYLAGKQNIPIIVDPVTKEIYVLSPEDFKEFLEISGGLTRKITNMHETREKVNTLMALEAKTPEQIRQAEKEMGIAQDEAIKEMNKQFKNQADIKEVLAFEMFTTQDGQQKLNAVRKYTNESQHIKNKNGRLNKFEFKLNYPVPWRSGNNEVTTGASDGNREVFDKRKFKENFQKTITDVSTEVKKVKGDASITFIPNSTLTEAFGITATELVESYKTSDSSMVDVQAQWLRLIASTGYDGTVKWGTKGFQASGSAYAQAKMVLLEGKKKWLWAYPSLKGCILATDGIEMGAIRFICGAEIYGFSGAVFAASSAFAVTVSNDGTKQFLTSVKRDPKATVTNAYNTSKRAVLDINKAGLDDEVSKENKFNAGINAFVGVQANITPFGGIQWLDPENPKDFTDLAKISPTLGLSAGGGVAGEFSLYYDRGAFRFKASLALCWGAGGKGGLEFTVDMKNIYMLVKFIAYQLTYATFKKLTYMLHDDFILLHKISMMLPFEDFQSITGNIDQRFRIFKASLAQAEKRIDMCRKINAKPQWLKYLSPESRGCFLYHITRYGWKTRMLNPSESEGWKLIYTDKEHQLPDHKKAIINLFQSVTQVSHWTNTLQHMSSDGQKSNTSISENEKELLEFLNLGNKSGGMLPLADLKEIISRINRDHNFPEDYESGNSYIDEYLKMRGKRILEYPKDYMITRFDSPEFRQIQIAEGLEKPESFLVQAPKPIEELDVALYGEEENKTWMA